MNGKKFISGSIKQEFYELAKDKKIEVIDTVKPNIYLENGEIKVCWNGKNETLFHVDTLKLLGVHNYENIMAACAIAICAGIPLQKIKKITNEFASKQR